MRLSLPSILSALAAITTAVTSVSAASDVLDLTKDTFASEVKGEKLALVEFFAPWCGHCKSLAPHYEEAATSLKASHGIKLAKVDCTENGDLCQDFGVRGYPTIKVFRSGEPADYTGPRKADGIISYMVKQSLPAMSEVTASSHSSFKVQDKVVVIAYAKSEKDVPKAYKALADSQRDAYLFGYTTDLSLVPSGLSAPSIVMYKSFDEGQVNFPDKVSSSLTKERLAEWIKEESIPIMDQVTPENFGSYAEAGLPLAYLFSEPEDKRLNALLDAIKPTAKKFKGKVNFVWIDAVKFLEHGKSLNIDTESFPGFVIQDMANRGRKYVLSKTGDGVTGSAIEQFLTDFEDGQLEPTLKSAPVPKEQDEPVYVVVGSEFDKVVMDDEKDVLIELYAPWCGHCQRLAPIWTSLGEHFEEFKDTLTIAKMDATENDLPASAPFEVSGFPTIKFKRAGTTEFVDYTGDRSLESLIDFVVENSNNPIEFAEEDDAAEGAVMGEVEEETETEAGYEHDEL